MYCLLIELYLRCALRIIGHQKGLTLGSLILGRLSSSRLTTFWMNYTPRCALRIIGVLESCLLRKEVIQPHLPIRLPCYDFTPIIKPTFGGALHKWLDYRLRVFPTLMV